jgi:hypothetical protein
VPLSARKLRVIDWAKLEEKSTKKLTFGKVGLYPLEAKCFSLIQV